MLMTPEIIAFLIQQNKSVQDMVIEQNKAIIEIAPSEIYNYNDTDNRNEINIESNDLSRCKLSSDNGDICGNIFSEKSGKIMSFFCEKCGVSYKNQKTFNNHLTTNKHQKPTNEVQNYFCKSCNLRFRDNYDFQKHLLTAKHKKLLNKECEIIKCEKCDIKFGTRSGLWKHKQRCLNETDREKYISEDECECEEPQNSISQPVNNLITPELIMLLIQQNKEMQHAMIEMAKNMGTNHSHNTTNNIQNNNKSFNLNVFLNETCKDAMNMSDFLNMLDVTTYDFEQTGKNGYVEGMCRILENGLNKLELHERPIHCTDAKRETIYIKDNDKWEKDDEQKTKLVSVIHLFTFQTPIFNY
jgi:hypothetical protein